MYLVFVMENNNWWIRDLFRYVIAILSSMTVIPYMIWSLCAMFIGCPNEEISEDSFSGLMVEYVWIKEESLNDGEVDKNEFEDIKKNDKSGNIILSMTKKTINDINQYFERWDKNNEKWSNENIADQFLQDSEPSYIQENAIEESIAEKDVAEETEIYWELTWWNKFDIEKIISDLHLQKEKRVAVVARELWIDWKKEKLDYARLAWIQWDYNWSLEQNQKIRDYLIANAQEIYKDKHWWNEWDTLPLVSKEPKKIKMNENEITWQVTYNDVTLKVAAPVGSFPEWTVLKIKTLGDDDSPTTFDITFKEVILMTQVDNVGYDAPMASFDISFYAPDDIEFFEELQPAEWKYVSVTFDYANNEEFNNPKDEWFLAIYHMEDDNETSVANLVSVKSSEEIKEDTKSESMSIYANTLSVYILTIVSDLDADVSENNETITLDTGYGWFIVDDENIMLSTTWTEVDATYTWKILSKNNMITLPDVEVGSWYTFSWWYNENIFVWNGWTVFELWNSNQFDSDESDLDSERYDGKYEIYACIFSGEFTWDICTINKNSGLDIWEESVDFEIPTSNTDIYTPTDEEIQKYGQNLFDAYNRAIKSWIATIDDVNKANLNKKITRAELAKLMVIFMSGVLEKEPVITEEVDYKDVDPQKLWDLAWYIQLAYQYQIMWINTDWSSMDVFNPNKTVTRAEFATVLSRVLFGDIYNQNWAKYYEKHIESLQDFGILSNTDPNLVESKWWIITMFYNAQSTTTNIWN